MTPSVYDLEPHLVWLCLENIRRHYPSAGQAIRTIKSEMFHLDLELMDALDELVACTRQSKMPTSLASARLRCSCALNNRSALIRHKIIRAFGSVMDQEAVALAAKLTKSLGDIYAFHAEHVRLWNPTSIKADWDGYRVGVHDKMIAIAQHLRETGSCISRRDVISQAPNLNISTLSATRYIQVGKRRVLS